MVTSPQWLNRYRTGQREQVWHELRQLGSTVRSSEMAEEAQLVCDEMARRARQDIEVIIERLTADGYRFHSNDDAQTPITPYVPPTPSAEEHAAWLQETFAAVPMTLSSWVRLVGDVWLVGTHPDWPTSAAADPLVIDAEGSRYPADPPIRDYFADGWNHWRQYDATHPDTGPFVLPLAQDRLHKDNVSGGAPYGIVLPDGRVDGQFVAETTTPFVSYLNGVFDHGRFPRPTQSPDQRRVIRNLAKDPLPL